MNTVPIFDIDNAVGGQAASGNVFLMAEDNPADAELLRQVAARLRSVLRDSDFLARLGGDEFVLVTDLLDHKNQVYPLLMRINAEFDRPFQLGRHRITSNTSIGVAFYPAARSLDMLVKQADAAMFQAKEDPASNVCFYGATLAARYSRHQTIELELGSAVEDQEFSTRFQPLVSAREPDRLGVEALARWHSGKLGGVSTDEFIRPAEQSPVAQQLTRIVVEDCNRFYSALAGAADGLRTVAINVGAAQLGNRDFSDCLRHWLDGLELPVDRLCVEITGRQMLANLETCKAGIPRLREQGIRVALDDYGSGDSSLMRLADLPLDLLKLDRALVAGIERNPRNQAITAGIVEMAHRLGIDVVAEGIERAQEKETAAELGCDYLQGHYFSLPLDHQRALEYFRGLR